MYNHKKLGSFLELKPKQRSITMTKKSARELYKHADNALLLDGVVYFMIDVTWTEPDSLMTEPMKVATIMVTAHRDTSNVVTIMRASSFSYSSLEHPDYKSDNIQELKGSWKEFVTQWLGTTRY